VLDVFPGIRDFGLFDVFQRVWKTGRPENHPVGQYQDDRITGWRDNAVYKLPSGEVVAVYSDETERKIAEEALKKSYDELELKVQERTFELAEANDRLKRMVALRKEMEDVLRARTHELDERVKELKCLYRISHLVEQRGISLEEILQGVVELIPLSWQYPDVAEARIVFEGRQFTTADFTETQWRQASDIFVYGVQCGTVEICYLEERPEADEGPFQQDERTLIDAVAGRLAGIVKRIRAEEALREKEEQQRQAEKRMDILRFANEVALKLMHELRNPLVSIGGYSRRISSREYPQEKLKQYGKIIYEQSKRLDNALNEALDHLRNAAGQV
jgi:K+-sensing histidine kinase KdpD